MKSIKVFVTIAGLFAVLACGYVYAVEPISVSETAGAKFASRLEKKQKLLVCMAIEGSIQKDLKSISNRAIANEGILKARNMLTSDDRYAHRLEKRLGLLVRDAMRNVGEVVHTPMQPMMKSTLMPKAKTMGRERKRLRD